MKWIDNLLANNWIPDWVKIESVDWKGFQMWLQSKRKMHQKLNYAFNQNLFFSNCIQFENFLQSYIIWNFFATVYHLKTVHIIFSTWYGGIQHVGLPIKAGLARALKSSIFLSGSVIVSHLRWRNTSKQFSQLSDRKWSCQMLIVVWQVWRTYLSTLSSSPTICRDQTAAQLNLHSDNVKIFWRQPLRQNYVETRAVAI